MLWLEQANMRLTSQPILRITLMTRHMVGCATSAVVLSLLLSCTGVPVEPMGAARAGLNRAELVDTATVVSSPVQNSLFMPVETANPAQHRFSASIVIPEHAMLTAPAEIIPAEVLGKQTQLFPELELGFISSGEYLVPLSREITVAVDSKSFWQIQVEPGRTWSETADGDMSRASFPFLLTSNIENESYNGVATFLYNDVRVSALRYQIVQQTSPFFVETFFSAWGQQIVDYKPQQFANATEVEEDFRLELADRWPVHSWQDLAARVGEKKLQGFTAGVDATKITASGLVIDGEIFVHSTSTPFGDYPYPNEMRHGVWSATKTAHGLVTMLRLAQKYGDEIFDYKIKDWLPVSAPHDGWEEVTFGHALSMATGIGTGSEQVAPNEIDDGYIYSDLSEYNTWYVAPTNQEKLQHLFEVPNHPWGPGTHVRYRDRDIYVLAAALDAIVKSREGPDTDLAQLMFDEVYKPLGIHHLPINRTKETDGSLGVPFLAWGMYLTADDTAKIGSLLMNGGRHDGQQLLSAGKLAEALYQTDEGGLPTGDSNQYGDASYHMTLWHFPYRTQSGKLTSVGQMHGWGGNVVSLIPNGMIAYRFGNGGYVPVEGAIPVADRIRPFHSNSSTTIE
jgi:CubicO group peptidase (beta-lactamase class C family)